MPAGTSLSSDQFYIDVAHDNLAAVAKSSGVTISDLLVINPGLTVVSKLTIGSAVRLPLTDNSRAAGITLTPDPQVKFQTPEEGQAGRNIQNGYACNSSSISKVEREGKRAGAMQLDPNPRPAQWLMDHFNIDKQLHCAALGSLAAGANKQTFVDPVVLDLNGDGVHLSDYKNSGVLFDVDHSGQQTRTEDHCITVASGQKTRRRSAASAVYK